MFFLVLVSLCSIALLKRNYLFMITCFQYLTLPLNFSHVENLTGTLKGGRADWLVEKCTVCFNSILKFYLVRLMPLYVMVVFLPFMTP